MFQLSPEWLTAICSMLILVGGALSNFYQLFQKFAANIHFQIMPNPVRAFDDESVAMRSVVLTPQRTKNPYQIVSVQAQFPIYQAVTLDNQVISFDTPFSLRKPIFIPSSSQILQDEVRVILYVDYNDLATHKPVIFVDCRSEFFPFRWRKRLVLSQGGGVVKY